MRIKAAVRMGALTVVCISSALAQTGAQPSAQTKVGQVLDGGAVRVSGDEFRQQIVGRYLVGPTPNGSANLEIVYLEGGVLRGVGQASIRGGGGGGGAGFTVEGTWTVDEGDRVCERSRLGSVVLAPRCQYWFRQADTYFVADSDSDRSARVTVRTVKKM